MCTGFTEFGMSGSVAMDALAMTYESDDEKVPEDAQVVYFPEEEKADEAAAEDAQEKQQVAKAMDVAYPKSTGSPYSENLQKAKPKAYPIKGPPPAKRSPPTETTTPPPTNKAKTAGDKTGPIIPPAWPQPVRPRIAPGPVPPPLSPPPPPPVPPPLPPPPSPAPVTPPKPSQRRRQSEPQEPDGPPPASASSEPASEDPDEANSLTHGEPRSAFGGGGWYTKMAIIISLWERGEWDKINEKFRQPLGFICSCQLCASAMQASLALCSNLKPQPFPVTHRPHYTYTDTYLYIYIHIYTYI